MPTPIGKRSTNLDELNQQDWDALEEMFEALEAVPVDKIENGNSQPVLSTPEEEEDGASA